MGCVVADGFPWARRVRPRRGLGGGDPDAPVLQLSKGSVYERVDGWAGLWVGLLKQEAGHGERGPWRVVKVSEGYWRWFLRSKRWIPDAKIFGFAGRSHETQK